MTPDRQLQRPGRRRRSGQGDLPLRVGDPAQAGAAGVQRADDQTRHRREARLDGHRERVGAQRQRRRRRHRQRLRHAHPHVGGRVAHQAVPDGPDLRLRGLAQVVVLVEAQLAHRVAGPDAVVGPVEQAVPHVQEEGVVVARVRADGGRADGGDAAAARGAQPGLAAGLGIRPERTGPAGRQQRHRQPAAVGQRVDVPGGDAAHAQVAAVGEDAGARIQRRDHLRGEVARPGGVDVRPAQQFELRLEPLVDPDGGDAGRGGVAHEAGAAVPRGVAHGRVGLVAHDLVHDDVQLRQRRGRERQAPHVHVGQDVAAVEHRVVVVALAVVAGERLAPRRHGGGGGVAGVADQDHVLERRARRVVVDGLQGGLDAGGRVADGVGVHNLDGVALAPPPVEQRLQLGQHGRVVARDCHPQAGLGAHGRQQLLARQAQHLFAGQRRERRRQRASARGRGAAGAGREAQLDHDAAGGGSAPGHGVVGHRRHRQRHHRLAGQDPRAADGRHHGRQRPRGLGRRSQYRRRRGERRLPPAGRRVGVRRARERRFLVRAQRRQVQVLQHGHRLVDHRAGHAHARRDRDQAADRRQHRRAHLAGLAAAGHDQVDRSGAIRLAGRPPQVARDLHFDAKRRRCRFEHAPGRRGDLRLAGGCRRRCGRRPGQGQPQHQENQTSGTGAADGPGDRRHGGGSLPGTGAVPAGSGRGVGRAARRVRLPIAARRGTRWTIIYSDMVRNRRQRARAQPPRRDSA